MSQKIVTHKKMPTGQRGFRFGSVPFPEPKVVTEESHRKFQTQEEGFTKNLDLITDTHLGKIIGKDPEDSKSIRQTSELTLREKSIIKKNPMNVVHVKKPFAIGHYSFNIRERTLTKNLMNVVSIGKYSASSRILS